MHKMALPAAVERAGQLADQLYEQAYGKPGESANTSSDAGNATPQSTDQAPAPPAAPAPAAKPPADEETYKSRYEVLTGKYNAEVPRMAAENRTLKDSVTGLTKQVETMAQQLENLQSKVPTESLIKPEEIQEFGEPLVDMSRRAGQEAAAKVTAPMQRELSQVRTELTDMKKTAADLQWAAFIDVLTTIVPGWAQINVDNEFLTWLDGVDDLTGATRQFLLDRAKEARDAPRVARFFTAWQEGRQSKATTSRSAQEMHAAPESSSRTVVPNGKPIITRAQIDWFYNELRAGRISAEDEIVMEAEINAAVVEGRVR